MHLEILVHLHMYNSLSSQSILVQCKQNEVLQHCNIVLYLLELVQFKVNNELDIAK